MSLNKQISITAVAIIKDEAPYIPEWVFHHKYFGIDKFHFLINRTTDKTLDVILSISKKNDNISYEYLDWVDQCNAGVANAIQQIGYAKAFYDLKNSTDYILFLDIDEFWCSSDFNKNIQSSIIDLNYPSCINYLWHCELGKKQNFTGFCKDTYYYNMALGKSIINTSVSVKGFRAHVPNLSKTPLLPSGIEFIPQSNNPQLLISDLVADYEYFVIHRIFKGEKEFLSNLAKGDMHTGKKMKTNRKSGFITEHSNTKLFSIPEKEYQKYSSYISSQINSLGIDVDNLQLEFLAGYQDFIDNIPLFYVSEKEVLLKTLRGIVDNSAISLIEECELLKLNFRSFFNHALTKEANGDFKSAISFMKAAQYFLPKNEHVKNKIKSYIAEIG